MSIDILQDKIRKMKAPISVNFSVLQEHIPENIPAVAGNFIEARQIYFAELLEALIDHVPAVRFSYPTFALAGPSGLESLIYLLDCAKEMGYYVFLDGVEALSAQEAIYNAQQFLSVDCPLHFDALIMPAYIGSDGIKPYLSELKEKDKDLFVVVRTANKTATELQDLITGTRLMHLAAADIVDRFTQPLMTKCTYSQLAMMAGASNANSLSDLRSKYKNVFMLVDGCDYPNANVKNCASAFDQIGHGAVVCAGLSVVAAWQNENAEADYCAAAVEAAKRLKKNLARYITVL